ncbi:hypothetical protein [Streptomyces radicis]|uniref:hypothetical protein n=1 Tax=Streptomyces radicis TaxID=1750517 RepID=UPI0011C3A879|nr:hypothetical protein [Streptomyces radicis]
MSLTPQPRHLSNTDARPWVVAIIVVVAIFRVPGTELTTLFLTLSSVFALLLGHGRTAAKHSNRKNLT